MGRTIERILTLLGDGKPRKSSEIIKELGLTGPSGWGALMRCWMNGNILRSENPTFERKERFRGRRGLTKNTRSYYLYLINSKGKERLTFNGTKFTIFSAENTDKRGAKSKSKAQLVLNFLKDNSDSAFYSTAIFDSLKDKGVLLRDIMATVRRYDQRVYVRGYRSEERQTPFKEGYLLTWINQNKERDQAIEEAIKRTDIVLAERNSTNPVIERVHGIRDKVLEATKLRELVGIQYLQNELGLTEYETENAVDRAIQLYPDLKETRLFGTYRYFYHSSLAIEDLNAAVVLKENYIRKTKGRDNRVGHNWEAVPEWFTILRDAYRKKFNGLLV